MLPQLHASANTTSVARVVHEVYICCSSAADTNIRLRETRSCREKRDHADGVGAVERMMVEVDRGGGGHGLLMMVVEGRSRSDEVELWGQATVDVSGGSGGGNSGGGPHSPSSGSGGGVVGGGGGAGIES